MDRFIVSVEGMHCAGCVGRVERVIAANGGCEIVVDLEKKCAEFSCAPEARDEIVAAINDIGFEAK